ncbi:MAG TPA: Crp/Fnr family transcriptional regulator [Bacteroidales bacterium]|nr:Crp/Fnr family transcriptional regulator [Bacteroidales bacterium]HPT21931.1 Crp/Fnr family transcriptional regulator [Bacteroidales bacterium]
MPIFVAKKMDYIQLSVLPIFKGLTPEEIEAAFAGVSHRVKKFYANSLISQSGEIITSMMIVLSGVVKGEMVDYAGRVIKIEDIPAPGALASAFIFGNRTRFPVNVVAVTDGELLLIEKSEFLKLLMSNNIILVNFLDMISNRSQFLSEKIKFLNFKTIKGKLAFYLLQKAGKDKVTIKLELTQNDLADFFGVTRPSVARALGDLEEEGFIEAKGKNIRITDREGLAYLTAD